MRTSPFLIGSLALIAGCQSRPATPAPAPAPTTAQAPTPPGGAPGEAPRPRRPRPTPLQLDSARQNQLAQLRAKVAGHENEKAGRYFKNVQVLKDLTVAELLRTMDEQYGRGLGQGCGGCHVTTDFSDDSRKNKKVARQMQRMQDQLNAKQLPAIKELGNEFDRVSCVTCHRGSEHPANTMDVPGAPATRRATP
jgi:hypothetical protein